MIYEYKCPKCGVIEINHSMKETKEVCPICGQKIERIITGGTGFVLKGGGWYKDGYCKKKED